MRGCSSAAEEEDSSASRTLRDTGGLLLPGDTLCNASLLVRIISDLQLWRGAVQIYSNYATAPFS